MSLSDGSTFLYLNFSNNSFVDLLYVDNLWFVIIINIDGDDLVVSSLVFNFNCVDCWEETLHWVDLYNLWFIDVSDIWGVDYILDCWYFGVIQANNGWLYNYFCIL